MKKAEKTMATGVTSSIPKPKKRKANVDDGGGARADATAHAASSRSRKKQKQKKQAAARRNEADDSLLDLEAGLNLAFASMDAQLLSDHLASQTGRFGTDLSSVELADLHVPAGSIRDTSSFGEARSLGNLPAFLEQFSEGGGKALGEAPEVKGAPHTIIVAGAGLRAADLTRAVRKYQGKGNTVAKLFAKHIKLEEAVTFLKTSRTGIAVGTPVRLMDLLDHGALSVDHIRRIVVDASHIDQKKRGVMDMKDTAMPLTRWLARKEFQERYADDGDGHLDLLFY